MVTSLTNLILASCKGEDCYFAIKDLLLEMGYPSIAEEHKYCFQQRSHIRRFTTRCFTTRCGLRYVVERGMNLAEFLELEERRVKFQGLTERSCYNYDWIPYPFQLVGKTS